MAAVLERIKRNRQSQKTAKKTPGRKPKNGLNGPALPPTVVPRESDGRWSKGAIPNPYGMSRELHQQIRRCRQILADHSEEAAYQIIDLMRNDPLGTVRFAAAVTILNQTLGKPTQRTEHEVKQAPSLVVHQVQALLQTDRERPARVVPVIEHREEED
jgi:hypothetical protein